MLSSDLDHSSVWFLNWGEDGIACLMFPIALVYVSQEKWRSQKYVSNTWRRRVLYTQMMPKARQVSFSYFIHSRGISCIAFDSIRTARKQYNNRLAGRSANWMAKHFHLIMDVLFAVNLRADLIVLKRVLVSSLPVGRGYLLYNISENITNGFLTWPVGLNKESQNAHICQALHTTFIGIT